MNLKRVLLAFLLIIIIGTAGLYFYIQSIVSQVGPGAAAIDPKYNYSVVETGVVDYGLEGGRAMYVVFSCDAQDMREINSSALQYLDRVPTDIYLLDYPCVECNGIEDFKTSLESELKASGTIAENSTLIALKINQLERLGKKGIVIVPTGRMPSPMLDLSSDANIGALMALGDVVIYIGNDFSLSLNKEGIVEQAQPGAAEALGISMQAAHGGTASPPYRFESGEFKITGVNVTQIAGAMQARRYSNGSGYFVLFPNTIDIGWSSSNGAAAGADVARVISTIAWQQPITQGSRNIAAGPDGRIPPQNSTLFLGETPQESGYVRLFTTATATNGSSFYQYQDLDISNIIRGRLKNTPFGVNNSIISLGVHFNVNSSDAKEFEAFLVAYRNLEEMDKQSIGLVRFINVSDENRRYTVDLGGGDHVLKVQDIAGRTYAQSFLHIPEVTLASRAFDWNANNFTFALLSDGIPVANTPITISVDGMAAAQLTTDGSGMVFYTPPESLGFGDHNFTSNATGRTLGVVTLNKKREQTFFDQTQNQVIIIGILLVGVLAVALRRAEVPLYYIDIPDFPPQQKERIPLPKSTFTNLIETLNREYRWKYMPLTTQEIKRGMQKRVLYKGKPILISDYNLEKLLGQLVDSGELTLMLGIYGLKGWEKLSGRSAHYLAVFRMLRNHLINNAMLFTDVGQRPDCDILVSHRGENLFIHIYENEDVARRAMSNAHKGKNFIIFADSDELKEFRAKLASSATRLSVALEMEIDNRQVILTHLGALGVLSGKAS